jgi:thiamine-monophosphate kinase
MTVPGADRPISDLGEDALVAGVIRRYPGASWLRVGPGDDAAVLDLPGGGLLAAIDTLVEDLDFRRAWSGGRDVGVKVAAQNFADLAAMGGRPMALLVSLALPGDVPVGWAHELADGVAAECARAGAVMAGGDLAEADQIVVTGSAIGTLDSRPAVLRSGAVAGDLVAVAGELGRSAAGLALLEAGIDVGAPGEDPVLAGLVAEHLRPVPPYAAGPAAARAGATAMIDTSDGLLRDAGRIARASGVVLDLDPVSLTPGPVLLAAARRLGWGGVDAGAWVRSGGEDHALVACFPADRPLPDGFRAIGRVRSAPPAGSGAVLVGGRRPQGPSGWVLFGGPRLSG